MGGVKTPGALVEASVSVVPRVSVPVCAVSGVRATPSVSVPVCTVASVVPVCVVSRCVFTSKAKCVLRRTHAGGERRCVRGASRVSATPAMDEPPGMSETPCASGVVTGVPACVLPGTPGVKGAPQLGETTCAREAARVFEPPCVDETPRVSAPACVSSVVSVSEARVSDRPCVRVTACARSLYTREMSVAMREHAAASPVVGMNVNGKVLCGLSLVARGRLRARAEWRLRLRLWRAKCRVAAVVVIGTVPGLHGRARVVRAVPRTRPPRARLRG